MSVYLSILLVTQCSKLHAVELYIALRQNHTNIDMATGGFMAYTLSAGQSSGLQNLFGTK